MFSKNLVSRWLRLRKQEVFYRQFHSMVKAGIALPTAFVQLRAFAPDDAFAEGLKQVARLVASGKTLAQALESQPTLFDLDQTLLLGTAEQTGSLERVLAALAHHLEELRRLRWKAFISSIWPAYLLGLAVFLAPLLRVTSAVNTQSDVVSAYLGGLLPGLTMLFTALVVIVFFPVAVALFRAELPWDRFVLRLPGVGGALRSLAASRALLTLGLSLSAGLEVATALRVAVVSTGRPSLQQRAEEAVQRVRSGSSLFEALSSLGFLDRFTLGQLGVAEQTGTLDATLTRLAPEVHEQTIRAIRVLTLVVVGVIAFVALLNIVGSLLGTIFGPIKAYYDLAGQPSQ